MNSIQTTTRFINTITGQTPPGGTADVTRTRRDPELRADSNVLEDVRQAPALKTAEQLIEDGRAAHTIAAYESDGRCIDRWLAKNRPEEVLPYDVETIVQYLTWCFNQNLKLSTIGRRWATIRARHRDAGYESPKSDRISRLLLGIRRHSPPKDEAPPLRLPDLERVCAYLRRTPHDPLAMRDAALIAVGWASGLRSAEIVSIPCVAKNGVKKAEGGLWVWVGASKTDQGAQEPWRALPAVPESPADPAGLVMRWIELSNAEQTRPTKKSGGLLFGLKNRRSVSVILKRRLAEAGVKDAQEFSAHSLRAGVATTMQAAGVPDSLGMEVTGHHSPRVYSGYGRFEVIPKHSPVRALLRREIVNS